MISQIDIDHFISTLSVCPKGLAAKRCHHCECANTMDIHAKCVCDGEIESESLAEYQDRIAEIL